MDGTFGASSVFPFWVRVLRRGSLAAVMLLVLTLLPFVPAYAAPASSGAPQDRSVPVKPLGKRKPDVAQSAKELWKPGSGSLPAGGSAVVEVLGQAAARTSAMPRVGGLPVRVASDASASPDSRGSSSSPGSVRVEVFDKARAERADVPVLMGIGRADGQNADARVRVEVDYSGLRGAFGAAWASRLQLVQFTDCEGESTEEPCTSTTVLAGDNDVERAVVSGSVKLDQSAPTDAALRTAAVEGSSAAGAVVALVAGASSQTGTFTRTPLASSSSWAAGSQSGDFSWSYDMEVPPSAGDLDPEIGLNYSSGRVDGQTNGENTQTSWVGEGWDYQAGYIERFYRPCKDDLETSPTYSNATSDLCYRDHNATLVLDGESTELVLDDASGTWRKSDDDGTRVELLTGGLDTRNWNDERWRLTTPDGTRYTFGLNWIDSRETHSVQGVPVFSNHANEPCYKATGFTASWCPMAYRWYLDLVEEPTGDVMSFFYSKEFNTTARAGNASTVTQYDRSATLARIEYGSRGFPQPSTPAMQVLFNTKERCLSSCWSGTNPVTANWPDTPWDLKCSGAPCSIAAPTFWSERRLESIETQVRTGSSYTTVDTWSLTHQFPSTNESTALTSPSLWLASITRTGGHGTATQSLPSVTFGGSRYANRTDHNVAAGVPLTNKYRVTRVATETGGQIDVTYEGSDCTATSLPADPATNTKRCFPQYYTPPDNVAGWAWWNKYRVTQVVEKDLVGGSPDMVTSYAYATSTPTGGSSSAVLWHHNDNAWTAQLPHRSWSDFRGWPVVTVTEGAAGGTQSQTRYVYFTGMHGDRTDAGENTRSVSITASDGYPVADYDSYAGMLREEIHYASPGGQALVRKIHGPWRHRTALRVEPPAYAQPSTFEAWFAESRVLHTFEWIAATGTWRQSELYHWYDTTYGSVTTTIDNGDTNRYGDETCTTYTYARNVTPTTFMVDYPAEELLSDCTASPGPANILGGTRTFYDGSTTLGAPPSLGLETRVDELASYTSSTPNWLTTETSTYDAHGRIRTATDALGHSTTTTYTPAAGSPVTAVTETNAAGHSTTDTLNLRGLPVTSADPNSKVTTAQYDLLGRLTKTWLPGRSTTATPNSEYIYTVTKAAASTVQTKDLGPTDKQISSVEIYDGFLRQRQTQTTAPDGKRVIADVRYDSRGLLVQESAFYNDASAPTGTLVTFADANVPTQRRYTFNGAGELTRDALWSMNAEKWNTTIAYDGDRVTIDPPAGGIPTTRFEDANGRTTRLLQHLGQAPSGPADETIYSYDRLDRLEYVIDPAFNIWLNTYDLRGRLTRTNDPDTGKSTYGYDDRDQLTTTTDGRGEVLYRDVDALGRITELRDDTETGPLRASWTYDTLAKGFPTSSTRHHSTGDYTQQVTGYTDLYQPTGRTDTIPASQGLLGGTYATGFGYHPDGTPATTTLPAKGGLPAETVTSSYTDHGYLAGVTGLDTYLASAQYYWHGGVKQQILGSGTKRARLTTTIEDSTGRLTKYGVETENPTTPDTWNEKLTERYTYDDNSNITGIAETSGTTTVANQCFGYDYLQRLTEAWTTAAATCQSTPSQAIVGGADAYWRSYTYDQTGNRLSDTRHSASGDTTRNYTYGSANQYIPHALTGITTNGGGPTTTSTYDDGGYPKTRTSTGKPNQTLNYDAEGLLATLANGTTTHSYVYDPDGNRLIADNPGTEKTLYLDDTEYHLSPATGQVTATRYYPNAVRTTTGGLTWMAANHHGTTELAINATTLTATRRRLTPFGEDRSATPPSWPDNKGIVGGTNDPTGYTHLGAREYDPTTGRFLSPDPLIDFGDPQTLHGYAYANNSPITYSDPDGLAQISHNGGGIRGGGAALGSSGSSIGRFLSKLIGKGSKKKPPKKAPWTPQKKQTGTKRMNDRNEMADVKKAIRNNPNKNRATKPKAKPKTAPKPRPKPTTKPKGNRSKPRPAAKPKPRPASKKQAPPKTKCETHSFAPTTPVLTADGTSRPISTITTGDKVLAHDPETGITTAQSVEAVHVHQDTQLTTLSIRTEDGTFTTLETTQLHPIWSETRKKWVNAEDLQATEKLRTASGEIASVAQVHNFTGAATMHDLTVSTIHTYYVKAGKTPVLVHNCGEDIYDTEGRTKHGRQARMTSRGSSGAEPIDGQAALDNSVEITPEAPGQAPRRIGASGGQLVMLDRTRQIPCGCGRMKGGVNNIWHGHVREWSEFKQDEQSAIIKAGLATRKGKVRG
ncbi:polymorphic toxin-type HINT domain-containing protein [Micromonospora zamorensis]|uniref:polymorphic toxin-type HINT domain-containing protein n=1 Tax=Micromonospora zamorensis TaxID=709883 RepID=UPI00368A874E